MDDFWQLVVSTFDTTLFPAHFKLAMKLLRYLFDCDLDEMKKRYRWSDDDDHAEPQRRFCCSF